LIYSQTSLEHLTEPFEAGGGPRLVAYQDSRGIWTIAWGHTRGVYAGMTCDLAQAEQWVREDIGWAQEEVNRLIKVPITQFEFDALVDFTFNCGAGNFEHSTLLELVNQGDMEAAALEFDKWDHCAGLVVAGLLRRREAERQIFEGKANA
jgi:lysozyme